MNLRRKLAFFMALDRYVQVIVNGVLPLSLPKAKANSLTSVKAYGGLLQGGVPSGYTAVEYVERPSGNTEQYIETNWKPNLAKNIRVQGIATYMGTITDYRPILLGNYTGTRSSTLNIEFDGRTQNNMRIYTLKAGAGTGGDLQVGPFATNDVVDFDIQITGSNGALAVSATVGGTTITGSGTIENVGEQTLYNMMLFKDHRATTTSASKVSSRIHYLKATEGDKVVFELIPAVRNSDNAVGFYDKVSGQFLTNQGTGSLTAGNAITPTPSDPLDLVCNNGALKVLDKTQWTYITNPTPSQPNAGVFIDSTGLWKTASDRGAGVVIPLTIGKQYTLLIHKKTQSLGTLLRYGQSPQATPTAVGVQLTDWYRGEIADGQIVSFVAKQPYFVMQLSAAAAEAGMMQEAIEVLEAQGDNEILAITTKNLCNVATDTDGYYIGADGTITASANSCYSAVIPVVAGKTYTWSGICGGSSYNNKRVHAYVDGVWNQQVAYEQVSAQTPFSITFTVPAGCNGIRISHFNDDTETQVELGLTKTAYIAYNDSTAGVANLLKIDNYVDTQEILTGLINHQLGIYVFDGTEDWTWTNNANAPARLNIPELDYVLNEDVAPVMCSHFMPTYWNNLTAQTKTIPYVAANQTTQTTAKRLVFTAAWDANITDLAGWKTFLATQYTAGTPVIVVYPLATAQDEVAPVPQTMQVVAGDNTLDIVQAGMSGLEAEAIYTKAKY